MCIQISLQLRMIPHDRRSIAIRSILGNQRYGTTANPRFNFSHRLFVGELFIDREYPSLAIHVVRLSRAVHPWTDQHDKASTWDLRLHDSGDFENVRNTLLLII